jgi:radical SAM protein with 4Fe4S-binding SPASM domain
LHTDCPQYIQFYPTLKCNLSCTFCFNRGIQSEKDISINDFENIISIIADTGVKEIDILGGEPTLHSEFDQIVNLIYKNNLKATISSNGFNIHLLEGVSRTYKREQIKIGVSIHTDSITRELHEYIIKYKPLLKSVCSKQQTIPETAKQYLRLSGIQYYLLFMDTVYNDDLKNSIPFYEFLKRIKSLKGFYENVDGVFCSGFIPDVEHYPVLRYVRCPAGTTKLSVMPDGSVYPCYLFSRHDDFRLGNILFDNFDSIWKNPILDFFRNFEKNSCINTSCELFSLCHGGCPAASLLIYGSMNAPDPRCVNHSFCYSHGSGNLSEPLF